jgi:hypothetical protein
MFFIRDPQKRNLDLSQLDPWLICEEWKDGKCAAVCIKKVSNIILQYLSQQGLRLYRDEQMEYQLPIPMAYHGDSFTLLQVLLEINNICKFD